MAKNLLLGEVVKFFRSVFGEKNTPNEISYTDRERVYDLLSAYYGNFVYSRTLDGGFLDSINQQLGEGASSAISGIYNPVSAIVDVYGDNVFRGTYGDEIVIDDKVGRKKNEKAVHPKLQDSLDKIADWSNINEHLDRWARMTALNGCSGIRVVAKVGQGYPNDEISDRRVYLQFEHPRLIEDYLADSRGFVSEIITRHRKREGNLSLDNNEIKDKVAIFRQYMSKTEFKYEKDGNPSNEVLVEGSEVSANRNVYGFVPYVVTEFSSNEGNYGRWCFAGKERQIDMINALIAHINLQVFRHVKATWVIESDGTPPTEFNMSGQKIIFIQRKLEEASKGTSIQSLVSDLSIAEAADQYTKLIEILENQTPELQAYGGTYLSGQSGKTVAELRLPAENKIRMARARMEASLIKAQKMALSMGVVLGLWDFGTGTGDIAFANQAFQQGLFDHRFVSRDALAKTEQEQIQNQADQQNLDQQKAGNPQIPGFTKTTPTTTP